MKKILLFFTLFMLTGCVVNQNTSQVNPNTSSIDTSAISNTTSSIDNSIKECNFEMDLSLYKSIDTNYEYNNDFGNGIVTTNKIYITCIFNFNQDLILSSDLKIKVNNNEVFSQDYDFSNKTITFKIEDTNWSNEY